MEVYKIQKLSELAEIPSHQLRYWDKIRLLKPSVKAATGKGSARVYSEQDVTAAKTIGRMIHVRVANQSDAEKVDAFYTRFSRSARMATSDSIVIAEDEGKVIGAIRLCTEEGYSVARTMIVDEEYRGKGIGKQMLAAFEELLHDRDCYGIAYAHLEVFYGRIGFSPILEQEAPSHLQKRYREYVASGRGGFIIMKRSKDM